MGRMPRVEYSGAIYHVIQRGNNKEYIFYGDEDKLVILREIEKRKISTEFKLYGYVIMDNHYYLVIQMVDEPLCSVESRKPNWLSRFYRKGSVPRRVKALKRLYKKQSHNFGNLKIV